MERFLYLFFSCLVTFMRIAFLFLVYFVASIYVSSDGGYKDLSNEMCVEKDGGREGLNCYWQTTRGRGCYTRE